MSERKTVHELLEADGSIVRHFRHGDRVIIADGDGRHWEEDIGSTGWCTPRDRAYNPCTYDDERHDAAFSAARAYDPAKHPRRLPPSRWNADQKCYETYDPVTERATNAGGAVQNWITRGEVLPEFPCPPNGVDLPAYYCSADRSAGCAWGRVVAHLANCVYVLTPQGIRSYGVSSEHTILHPDDTSYQEAESLWRAAMAPTQEEIDRLRRDHEDRGVLLDWVNDALAGDLTAEQTALKIPVLCQITDLRTRVEQVERERDDAQGACLEWDRLCQQAEQRVKQAEARADGAEVRLHEFEKPVVGSGSRTMTLTEAQSEVIIRLRRELDEVKRSRQYLTDAMAYAAGTEVERLRGALIEAQRVLKWGYDQMLGRPPQHWLDAIKTVADALGTVGGIRG